MTKSSKIAQILKDNNIDHVEAKQQEKVIMEQKSPNNIIIEHTPKRPHRMHLQDTMERPDIFGNGFVPREPFSPSDVIKNISEEFWIPEDQVKFPPEDMLLKIKEHKRAVMSWKYPKDDKTLHCVTFFAKREESETLLDALSNALTTYVPELQAIACNDWVTFILPEDKCKELILAVDFAGDKLTPHDAMPIEQRNPTLTPKQG